MADAGGGGGGTRASLDVHAAAFVPRGADAPAAPAGRGQGRSERGRGRGRGRGRAVPSPRGAGQEAEAPPAAADAPRAAAAPQRGRGRGRGRGARGESAGRGLPAPAEEAAAPVPAPPAAGRGRGKAAAKAKWWRSLEEDDPITLEPLASLAYPPFELAPGEGAKRYHFDGQALASYLHASKCFQNPLNREALTRETCVRLDAYLRQHKLGRFTITRDFDDAAAAAAAAAAAGTAEALAAERAAAADALLRAFFAGSSRRGDARRGGPQTTPAMQGEGNFVVMDDDAGMLRGRSRRAAEAALAERPEAAAAARSAAEAFPALPGAAPARPAWPALSSSAAPVAAAAPRSAAPAAAAPTADRPLPSWWAMAAPAPPRAAPPASARGGGGSDDAGEARRKQLAAAFGVSDPSARPSMFAAASAAAFSPDVLALARADRAFVLDVEKRLDAALAARARRTSMPPCGRPRRKLIHEVAERYGLVSSSYGEGPGRHVDVFCLPTSGHPTGRLSDAALAPPEAVAAVAPTTTVSKADAAAQLRISVIEPGTDIERLLGDGAVLTWQSATEAVAQFATVAAMQEARDRLGGGLRGIFTVAGPPAEAAPPPRRSAAPPDPWADEAPPARVAPKRPTAAVDWQSLAETEAGVPAPLKGHIATRNAWALLDEGADGADDADGDWEDASNKEKEAKHAASDDDESADAPSADDTQTQTDIGA